MILLKFTYVLKNIRNDGNIRNDRNIRNGWNGRNIGNVRNVRNGRNIGNGWNIRNDGNIGNGWNGEMISSMTDKKSTSGTSAEGRRWRNLLS